MKAIHGCHRVMVNEIMNTLLKRQVSAYWNAQSCGEVNAVSLTGTFDLDEQARERYVLEPYIFDFAKFHEGKKRNVLEIGIGMGADHALWVRSAPAILCGIDLTQRAIQFTAQRLARGNLNSMLQQGDAENLPFRAQSFDVVYSWGVLHHSPDTSRCIGEVFRVLRPEGIARIMIYHKWSLVGLMLWCRYALLSGKPLRHIDDVYFQHLESPGTKAYTVTDARRMFATAGFSSIDTRIQLSHGDLLQGNVGARHQGVLLSLARWLWPRSILKVIAPQLGLYLLIEAVK
jgi:ubiquinone/menaquinone biosynthesis C-methylase UbiE